MTAKINLLAIGLAAACVWQVATASAQQSSLIIPDEA
jgi:hypothetical protein